MAGPDTAATFTAFAGHRRIAWGEAASVAAAASEASAKGEARVLIFDDRTGEQVELGPPGRPPFIVPRAPPAPARGRPRLGVVAREVTLLPRHWDWLSAQPGGASAALRRLVEAAARANPGRARTAPDVLYKVLTALAGDLPGYEAAIRALFAGDRDGFALAIAAWPTDVRAYAERLTGGGDSAGNPRA